jgi:arginine utilization protein RocB
MSVETYPQQERQLNNYQVPSSDLFLEESPSVATGAEAYLAHMASEGERARQAVDTEYEANARRAAEAHVERLEHSAREFAHAQAERTRSSGIDSQVIAIDEQPEPKEIIGNAESHKQTIMMVSNYLDMLRSGALN